MDGRWHHVALTIAGARTTVYVDGRRTTALFSHPVTIGDLTMLIGNPLDEDHIIRGRE